MNPIKVLVVEDSPLASKLLTFIINSDPQLEVIGIASSGEEAIELLKVMHPDVITMDIVLPGINGFETTEKILHTDHRAIPIIIVSANYRHEDIDKSFKAVVAGAIDILEKPAGPRDPNYAIMADKLLQAIKNAHAINLMCESIQPNEVEVPNFNELHLASKIRAIAMGASLGGPKALNAIFSKLPAKFPIPILLVQHISAGFTKGFVDWLGQNSALTIKIAEHEEELKPATVYVAPDQSHMEAGPNGTLLLNTAAPIGGLRPSISILFRSMAVQYGSKGMGILLTGMGRDGAEDLLLMKRSGAVTIAQDQRSCLVFGMPKEAIKLNAAVYVLSLNHIIQLFLSLSEA